MGHTVHFRRADRLKENYSGQDIILGLSVSGGLDAAVNQVLCSDTMLLSGMGDGRGPVGKKTGESKKDLWFIRKIAEFYAIVSESPSQGSGGHMSLWAWARSKHCRSVQCPHFTVKEWPSGRKVYCELFSTQPSKVRLDKCPYKSGRKP